MLVGIDDRIRLTASTGHGDGNELVVESSLPLRGDRTVMRPDRQFVLLVASDPVLTTQVLRGLDHPAGHRMRLASRCQTPAFEPVHQFDAARAYAGAQSECVVLDVRHRFRTTGDHQVCSSGRDLRRAVEYRLQSRAAAAVDLHTRYPDPEPCVERSDPAQRRRLAIGVPLPEDHVVDVTLTQTCPRRQFAQQAGREVGNRQRREDTSHSSDRGAQRRADHDICGGVHGFNTRNCERY